MRRTEVLQEIRKMRFEEAYGGWQSGRLTQGEAASLLGVCERTFRRHLARYEALGLEGLIDRRLEEVSHRKAPVDEVLRMTEQYRQRHEGWSVKHFYAWYARRRSHTWVKSRLQDIELVAKAKVRGAHRKRRDRSPWPGLMIHQDGSSHEWVAGTAVGSDRDDGRRDQRALLDVLCGRGRHGEQLGGVREVIESRGLFSRFYSDRGSYYWHTP